MHKFAICPNIPYIDLTSTPTSANFTWTPDVIAITDDGDTDSNGDEDTDSNDDVRLTQTSAIYIEQIDDIIALTQVPEDNSFL